MYTILLLRKKRFVNVGIQNINILRKYMIIIDILLKVQPFFNARNFEKLKCVMFIECISIEISKVFKVLKK